MSNDTQNTVYLLGYSQGKAGEPLHQGDAPQGNEAEYERGHADGYADFCSDVYGTDFCSDVYGTDADMEGIGLVTI